MSKAAALRAERTRRVPDRLSPKVASSEELPGGLDWQAFSTRYFPGRLRHDLEALMAYGAYRRLPRMAEAPSFERTNEPIRSAEETERVQEANGGAVVRTAVEAWEDEGGSAP